MKLSTGVEQVHGEVAREHVQRVEDDAHHALHAEEDVEVQPGRQPCHSRSARERATE